MGRFPSAVDQSTWLSSRSASKRRIRRRSGSFGGVLCGTAARSEARVAGVLLGRDVARVAGRARPREGEALRRDPRSDVAMGVTSPVRSVRIVVGGVLRPVQDDDHGRDGRVSIVTKPWAVATVTPRLHEVVPLGTSTG